MPRNRHLALSRRDRTPGAFAAFLVAILAIAFLSGAHVQGLAAPFVPPQPPTTPAPQGSNFTPIPENALAWWRLDPSVVCNPTAAKPPNAPATSDAPARAADPSRDATGPADADARRSVLEALLRTAALSGVLDADSLRIVQAVLAASVVGGSPHQLCLLDLSVVRDPHPEPAGSVVRGVAAGGVGGEGDRYASSIQRASLVLEIRTSSGHAAILRTLRSILTGEPRPDQPLADPDPPTPAAAPSDPDPLSRGDVPPGSPVQRALTLPGNRSGVALRRESWPDWREVSWCSEPGVFTIGLGRGSLDAWFAQPTCSPTTPSSSQQVAPKTDSPSPSPDLVPNPTSRLETPPWTRHEAISDSRAARLLSRAAPSDRAPLPSASDNPVFFRAYCSVDALRRAAPDTFSDGIAAAFLRALGLANARDVMFHARWVPPSRVNYIGDATDALPPYSGPGLIAIDATWSARLTPPDDVRWRAVTESAWPAGRVKDAAGVVPPLPFPPPPGSFAMVIRADWVRWTDLACDAYSALLTPVRAERFGVRRRAFMSSRRGVMERVWGAAAGWVVISDFPRTSLAVPGAATVYVPMKTGMDERAWTANVRSLLDPFSDLVRFDEPARTWSVTADKPGIVRLARWGLARTAEDRLVLVGGLDVGLATAPDPDPARAPAGIVATNRHWLASVNAAGQQPSPR